MKTKKILRKLKKIGEEKNKLTEKLHENQSKTKVKCKGNHISISNVGCGKEFEIGKLTYIQTFWYEEPYGCTGGANWHEGEGQWSCPLCGVRNRLYNKKEIEKLKYRFKNIVKAHGHSQIPDIDK